MLTKKHTPAYPNPPLASGCAIQPWADCSSFWGCSSQPMSCWCRENNRVGRLTLTQQDSVCWFTTDTAHCLWELFIYSVTECHAHYSHAHPRFIYIVQNDRMTHFAGLDRRKWDRYPQNWTWSRYLYSTCPLPKFHHRMFNHSEIIVFTNKLTNKSTKKFRQKHPPQSAMLHRRIIDQGIVTCVFPASCTE